MKKILVIVKYDFSISYIIKVADKQYSFVQKTGIHPGQLRNKICKIIGLKKEQINMLEIC